MTDPRQMRIGTSERDGALTLLGEHLEAGRLAPDEYADRAGRVRSAVTAADLQVVFADLPGGFRFPSGASGPQLPPTAADAEGMADGAAASAEDDHSGAAGRWIAIAGPLSLALFFVCGFAFDGWGWAWLFFLLPGALGLWMYNNDGAGSRAARRDRRRDGRR